MSLILVATVCGVLLERCVGARRTVVWGHAGAERGTRPATVRGPPTAVFEHPLCQTHETAVGPRPGPGLTADGGDHSGRGIGDRDLGPLPRRPVPQLDDPVGQPATDGD